VTGEHLPLGSILARRIAFFAVLAMLLQLAVVFSDYYWNDGELSRLFVEQETERLADGIEGTEASTRFHLPQTLRGRYGGVDTGYFARVRTSAGVVLFSSCTAACEKQFLPLDVRPPSFWLRTITPGKPLTLAGGRAFPSNGETILVEVVTLGDPQNVLFAVLWREVLDHMIVPMGILLTLVLGGTLWSVRIALKPVRAAALAAHMIDPLDSSSHLSLDDMPLEVARLAEAVNRVFLRVGELMTSQKILTSGIAHEVRTPLAAMKLELARIDHPRARKAEADLDELAAFVSQLTALARLEGFDHSVFAPIDLARAAGDVVETLAPWVFEQKCTIGFDSRNGQTVSAVESLVKDAIRNLVENAVKHTAPGGEITVGVDERTVTVSDFRSRPEPDHRVQMETSAGHLGIGLKIVERIVQLHGASFELDRANTGTKASIRFAGRRN
jgi:two-component system, OmpR family, sensor histidine kinase QseC